jgi:hypothetical protein
VKKHLWAMGHFFEFASNQPVRAAAGKLRQSKIQRLPFALSGFRGIAPEHAEKLVRVGIGNVAQMLTAGATASERERLALESGVPLAVILELVKLSDLARIQGLKGIRARLYYDAGVDTLDKLADWEPEALREMLTEFVERTGFDGMAPWPKEARNAVATAKKLARVVAL